MGSCEKCGDRSASKTICFDCLERLEESTKDKNKIVAAKLKVISKSKNENGSITIHLSDDRNDENPKQSTYVELKIDIYQPLIQDELEVDKYFAIHVIPIA
jgi:hypothetical protein